MPPSRGSGDPPPLPQLLALWGLLFLPPCPDVPGYSSPGQLALCALLGLACHSGGGGTTARRGLVWERLRWSGWKSSRPLWNWRKRQAGDGSHCTDHTAHSSQREGLCACLRSYSLSGIDMNTDLWSYESSFLSKPGTPRKGQWGYKRNCLLTVWGLVPPPNFL